jgi:8-oxo-dGTP pyrophosphatase MutT (NUDIX family)
MKKRVDYNKIGLLILNKNQNKFLVCEPGKKYKEKQVKMYLLPGGQIKKGESEIGCLKREIKQELDSEIDLKSLQFISEYYDVAATPGKYVKIRLYKGKLLDKPKPSTEIGRLRWIGKKDINNPKVSPILRNKIILDLVKRGILK